MEKTRKQAIKDKLIKGTKSLLKKEIQLLGTKLFTKNKPYTQKEIDELGPAILMIDDDLTGKLKFGAVPGKIEWKGRWSGEKTRLNILRGSKLIKVEMPGGTEVPMWIHFKNEVYSYPHTPLQDAEAMGKTITGIQQNYKNLETARKYDNVQMWMEYLKILGWIAGGILIIYIGAPWVIDLLSIPISLPEWWVGPAETAAAIVTAPPVTANETLAQVNVPL